MSAFRFRGLTPYPSKKRVLQRNMRGASQPRQIQTMEFPMLDNLVRKYHSWQKYRRTYDELSRLSNRELNDLGIGRGDIDFIARSNMR